MKIVLAYSGGLDTSVLLSWIKEKYNAEMIAFCANIGQEEELKGLEKKARQTGASKIYIDNLQEEFARDFIFPLRARRFGGLMPRDENCSGIFGRPRYLGAAFVAQRNLRRRNGRLLR